MPGHWFPKITRPLWRCVALVFRPGHPHNQMATGTMFWVSKYLMRFQLQLFDAVPAALHWLVASDAGAVQRLQAERGAELDNRSPSLSI